MGSFYLTTPIYYASGEPHLGHAYTTILADVLARYHRRAGDDVLFLTGTDEHGQKIQEAAAEHGLTPLELCDRMVDRFKAAWVDLGISNDRFIRTTEPEHIAVVGALLERLYDNGFIYEAEYTGWYSVGQERYFTEKEIGPDRVDPIAGGPVTRIREKNWFFRMSLFRDRLVEHIEKNPEWIVPATRRNEVLGFLSQGLGDLSISRPRSRIHWGIPIPWDPDQVTYVWVDALTNYVTAAGAVDPDAPREPARVRGSAAFALACRRPPHGQGHHHHPRGVLAHPADGCRPGAAPEDSRARLVGRRRHQDVQVARKRGGPARPARTLRSRSRALVSDARDGHRPGRIVHTGAVPDPVRRSCATSSATWPIAPSR